MPCCPSPPLSPRLQLPLVISYWIVSVLPGRLWAVAVFQADLLLAGLGTWTPLKAAAGGGRLCSVPIWFRRRHRGQGQSGVTACDLPHQVQAECQRGWRTLVPTLRRGLGGQDSHACALWGGPFCVRGSGGRTHGVLGGTIRPFLLSSLQA